MTNVPTLESILIAGVIFTIFPFLMGFFLSYISFRSAKLSLLGGVICVPAFLFMSIVPLAYIVNGLLSGLISCLMIWDIFYKTTVTEYIPVRENLRRIPNSFSRKNIAITVIALLIIAIVLYWAAPYKLELIRQIFETLMQAR